MHSEYTIQAAKAMASAVYDAEFPESAGRTRHLARCPFHPDRTPSFSIDRETGAFKCFGCGVSGGDIIEYRRRRTGESFRDAVESLAGGHSLSAISRPSQYAPEERNEKRAQAIKTVLAESLSIIQGCPAYEYLSKTRGLSLEIPPQDLWWHPGLKYWDDQEQEFTGTYPALIGGIRNPAGAIVNLHRTFLTSDGKKAPVESPKRIMASPQPGIIRGGAIRLHTPDKTLGVAEGIETAIAAQNKFGLPVWACINAEGLRSVALPETVQEVVIFADNDASQTGAIKAKELARRLLAEGRAVKSVMPNRLGTDWAETDN